MSCRRRTKHTQVLERDLVQSLARPTPTKWSRWRQTPSFFSLDCRLLLHLLHLSAVPTNTHKHTKQHSTLKSTRSCCFLQLQRDLGLSGSSLTAHARTHTQTSGFCYLLTDFNSSTLSISVHSLFKRAWHKDAHELDRRFRFGRDLLQAQSGNLLRFDPAWLRHTVSLFLYCPVSLAHTIFIRSIFTFALMHTFILDCLIVPCFRDGVCVWMCDLSICLDILVALFFPPLIINALQLIPDQCLRLFLCQIAKCYSQRRFRISI